MMIFHDSRNILYRNPVGPASCGTRISLGIRAEGAASVTLRMWWNNTEILHNMRASTRDFFTCDFPLPKAAGLLWYYFLIQDRDGRTWFYGNAPDRLGGIGQLTRREPPSYQITVYDGAYTTPKWLRNGVMMQIMPDRFCASKTPDPKNLPAGCFYHPHWNEDPILVINDRTGNYAANDYFGGDLKGIESKLDMLRDLGVTVLYLNPIFKAAANHKYNTGDYMTVDPSFGTEADFRHLCAEAKKRGIRILLDGVFSHTGSDSLYFNKEGTYGKGGAYNDPDSPYRPWFTFRRWPHEYNSWWGFATLPTVNKDDPSFRKFIINGRDSVVAHWLHAGSSGWRLDVADELPMDFIAEIRKREKAVNPDSALIGEVWEDPSNKVAYGKIRSYCLGDTLDCSMNYPLRDAVFAFLRSQMDAIQFVRRIESMRENLPAPFFYSQMNLLGSHDKARALTVLAEVGEMEPERSARRAFDLAPEAYARGKRRLIAAWKLICALPGMPSIYYGDEAGLYGMSDPMCRGTYPWGREDTELKEQYRRAIARRHASAALRTGSLKMWTCGIDVAVIQREITGGKDIFGDAAPNDKCALAVNRACEPRWIDYSGMTFEIPPESAVWLTRPAERTRTNSMRNI